MIHFQSSFCPEKRKELPSRNILEREVQISWVLIKSTQIYLPSQPLTKKGCSILARIEFSWSTWSTCFNFTMSNFFKILSAKYFPVFFYFASLTLPNEPSLIRAHLFPKSEVARIRKFLVFSSKPFLIKSNKNNLSTSLLHIMSGWIWNKENKLEKQA